MKKITFALILMMICGIVVNKIDAQTNTLKIGVFDMDQMVQSMPEFKTIIQPKLVAFQKDSLGAQKDQLDTLFTNARNTYNNDSLAKKSVTIVSYDRQQLEYLYSQEVNWEQYVQQATQQKYAEVAKPTYDKVIASYKKVLANTKVTLVLKPTAVQDVVGWKAAVNLFELVAKDLGVKLNNGEENASAANK